MRKRIERLEQQEGGNPAGEPVTFWLPSNGRENLPERTQSGNVALRIYDPENPPADLPQPPA